MDIVERLESMLAAGKDSPLLRYGLGVEYAKRGEPEAALAHLARAVEADPDHSAAWKAYGRSLAEVGRHDEAAEALRAGMRVAETRGDVQAAKEMAVFLKRAERARSEPRGVQMNEDQFNLELRKFLKKVGITSQREIEKAVRERLEAGKLEGNEQLSARVILEVPDIELKVEISDTIALER